MENNALAKGSEPLKAASPASDDAGTGSDLHRGQDQLRMHQ